VGTRSAQAQRAPVTFNTAEFIKTEQCAGIIGRNTIHPRFDGQRNISIAHAREIAAEAAFVVVEGNCFLLSIQP